LHHAKEEEREKWQGVVAEKEITIAKQSAALVEQSATLADKDALIAKLLSQLGEGK